MAPFQRVERYLPTNTPPLLCPHSESAFTTLEDTGKNTVNLKNHNCIFQISTDLGRQSRGHNNQHKF
jgi:hypothetical protein